MSGFIDGEDCHHVTSSMLWLGDCIAEDSPVRGMAVFVDAPSTAHD